MVVEPRNGDGNFTVIFNFSQPVLGGSVSLAGTGSVTAELQWNSMIVQLTGVMDQQTLTVTALNVTGTNYGMLASTSVQIGFLVGDVNGDGVVNVGDTAIVRGQAGAPLDNTNFQSDVNGDGQVNVGDTITVQLQSGHYLPPVAAGKSEMESVAKKSLSKSKFDR